MCIFSLVPKKPCKDTTYISHNHKLSPKNIHNLIFFKVNTLNLPIIQTNF